MYSFFVPIFAALSFFAVTYTESSSLAYPRAPCPSVRLQNGKTRIRGRGRSIKFSCYSGFFLVGDKFATCIRGEWDAPIPVCASFNCTILAKPDHSMVDSKFFGAVLIYYCEPGYTLIGNAEIYCDGKRWNGTAPYCRDSKAIAPTSCDFEKPDLCWWEQDTDHNFDWRRHNFETPSSHIGTGPTSDHTLGPGNDGYYLYIEASGRLVNETARILSPLYNSSYTASGCFSFWYHMFGATIGSLNVYFKLETENVSKLMFTQSGNQGNKWHRGIFNFTPTESNFQIIIEGVRGSSYVSDIAVDDVAILQGDECVAKAEIESGTTPNLDDDQVEIVNSMQTCQGRCDINSVLTTPSSNDPTSSDICHCTGDCALYSMCCPDFYEYCIYRVTDSFTDMIDVWSTKAATEKVSGLTQPRNEVIFINSTDGIDPLVPQEKTTTSLDAETPFLKMTQKTDSMTESSDCELCYDNSDVIVHDTQSLLKRKATLSVAKVFGISVAVLAAVCILTAIASLVIIHRRKVYKRGNSSKSALSEDSDVRFLTSDEVLDFSLARPPQDGEEI